MAMYGVPPVSDDNGIRELVKTYLKAGWSLVPIPPGKKAPSIKDWPNSQISEADLIEHCAGGGNLGVILGERSGNLVDMDVDAPEALPVAFLFLPETGRVHGRAGKPGSHWWYRCTPLPKTTRYQDLDGQCLVELRSTGSQTVIPPSKHPSGEHYVWGQQGESAVVDTQTLHKAVAHMASAILVARHWPESGSRHECALALAGFLLRDGMSEGDATRFVEAVTRAAGDGEWSDRLRAVRDTAKRLATEGWATGGPTLFQLLRDGSKVVTRLQRWLGLPAAQDSRPGQYRVEEGRICRVVSTKDGIATERLCNFVATVTEELIYDDAMETTRAFVLKGALDTGEPLPRVCVPASRFPAMGWVTECWGLRAVVSAGQAKKDFLREAIQRLSPEAPRQWVYTHTGWREVNGKWFYLTASGAVGGPEFNVELEQDLSRYRLPCTPEDVRSAMQTSLGLLRVGPLTVTAPLWASVYRPPLACLWPADLSLWLEATTGSLKSTLAALFLSHYGEFDRLHLPGTWSSTANQLERRAFMLKDVLFVVDDYAPNSLTARELEAKAGRLLRAQGNAAGRGRLRADLRERQAFAPRGLVLATGEQHPSGQSVLARTLLIELRRKDLNLELLTRAQQAAGRLPHAMTGYILWLAPQMPSLSPQLRETFEGARSRGIAAESHLRIPEALAHLWLGLRCGLTFAEEVGACSASEAEDLSACCWDALLALGRAQGQLLTEERPLRRFLLTLLTLVKQGRCVLRPKEETGVTPGKGVELLGWFDEELLYLIPEATYRAIALHCREAGEPFPVSRIRLMKDLVIEGFVKHDPDRSTKVMRVGGRHQRLLCLKRACVEDAIGEEFPAELASVTGVTGSGA